MAFLTVDLHQLLSDHQPGTDDVDVLPSKAAGFPATQPARGHDLERGPEPMGDGGIKEGTEFLRLPGAHLGPDHARSPGVRGCVAPDQAVPPRVV